MASDPFEQRQSQAGQPVDLTNCDREPIHVIGHVRPFGILLAVSPDWIVGHASANAGTLMPADADALFEEWDKVRPSEVEQRLSICPCPS